MNAGIPATFLDVLVLAAVLIFFVTSIAALVTTIIISRDGMLYLGSQLALFFFALYLSRDWSYPLLLSPLFESVDTLGRAATAAYLIAIAFAVDMALKYWVWEGTMRHDGQIMVPKLLIGMTRLMIYLIAVLTVLQFVYGQSITALVTLSGAFALVLGLSAQATLGEMFAGIAIAVSKPFRVGDWIKVGNLEEGQVVDMTWRLVQIRNRDHYILNITNRLCADQPIKNFTFPAKFVRITELIYFNQELDPTDIQAVLTGAVRAAPGVLADPMPSVLFRGARDGVAEYSLRYYIDDYTARDNISENVWKMVIEATRRHDLSIALPRRRIELSSDPIAAIEAAQVKT